MLVAKFNECIDFAEEWNEEDVIDGREDVDAVAWHGIKRVDLFQESYYGAIAIGMWGGGYNRKRCARIYDTSADDNYDVLEYVTEFIQQYFDAVEDKTVLAELEVYKDGTTLLDKIKTK